MKISKNPLSLLSLFSVLALFSSCSKNTSQPTIPGTLFYFPTSLIIDTTGAGNVNENFIYNTDTSQLVTVSSATKSVTFTFNPTTGLINGENLSQLINGSTKSFSLAFFFNMAGQLSYIDSINGGNFFKVQSFGYNTAGYNSIDSVFGLNSKKLNNIINRIYDGNGNPILSTNSNKNGPIKKYGVLIDSTVTTRTFGTHSGAYKNLSMITNLAAGLGISANENTGAIVNGYYKGSLVYTDTYVIQNLQYNSAGYIIGASTSITNSLSSINNKTFTTAITYLAVRKH
jgi:hypothetical protein